MRRRKGAGTRSDYEIVLRRSGRDKTLPFKPKEIADLPGDSVTRLDPGSHETTATTTNSGGKARSASILVEVGAVPAFFDAG